MNSIENFYSKRLKYDLINKFFYTNLQKLPKIRKIVLTFVCKKTNLKLLANNTLALELITNQRGFLKLKKGNVSGCALTLTKKSKLNFMSLIITEILKSASVKQISKGLKEKKMIKLLYLIL